MAKKTADEPELKAEPEAEPEPPLTLTAPVEATCHEDFEVHWKADGAGEVIIAGRGVVTASPVRLRAHEQGRMVIGATAKWPDGKTAHATATVHVVMKK